MSLAATSERVAGTDTPEPGFYALVSHVATGLLSKKVACLTVEVFSGIVRRGDPIELVHEDGSTTQVIGRAIRKSPIDEDRLLDLDEPRPMKADVGAVEIARTPGLEAPPLPRDGRDDLQRLLDAVRAARAAGFPEEQARPIKPVLGVTPETVCKRLRRLPDEADVLLIQAQVQHALAKHGNPMGVLPDCEKAAMYLSAVGLREDGDALLLAASAALQGHKVSPSVRMAASLASTVALSAEGAVTAAGRVGWALGIEMGEGFGVGFKSGMGVPGEAMETLLLQAGRAVGIAWCKKCHDVVTLDVGASGLTGSRQLHCPNDGRKADEPVIVVPSAVPGTMQALRTHH